jgi:Protein of unknown function (DUF2795)
MAEHDENPTAAEVQEYLQGVSYPASGDQLRQAAEKNGAKQDDRAWGFFETLEMDQQFTGPQEVQKEFGNYSESSEDMDETA